jgi:bifunctional DNase/RNase
LEVLDAQLERVEVTALKENTFYGNLVVSHQGRVYNIDARPSDAIALAVRAHVPIYVAREVMDEAAIVPDEGMEESGEQPPTPPPPESTQAQPPASSPPQPSPQKSPAPEAADEDRLSVFADFLEKIDLDDLEKPDSNPDQPEEDDKP